MTAKFEYVLNAMENAAAQDNPSAHDYFRKRQAVLKYVAEAEARVEELQEALKELHDAVEARADTGKRRSLTVSPKMEQALLMAEAALSAKEKKP